MEGFVMTDGEGRYIHANSDGKYVEIIGLKNATVWRDKVKAANVFRSSLPQRLRGRYQIVSVQVECTPPPNPQNIASLLYSNGNTTIEVAAVSPAPDEMPPTPPEEPPARSTADIVESLMAFVTTLDQRVTELSGELSNADKEISDIYHAIELESFNAYQGWAFCKRLQTVLKRRRKIKNEMDIIHYVGNSKMTVEGMATLSKSIDGMANRKYRTRITEQDETEGSA